MTALERCAVPVVAAVHGACVGAGVDLITAADIRLATEDARFSVKEVDLAIVAGVPSLLVTHLQSAHLLPLLLARKNWAIAGLLQAHAPGFAWCC